MVRRARGVGLVIGQDGLSSVCIGHELGQQLAASRTHHAIIIACGMRLPNSGVVVIGPSMSSPLFARAFLKVRETPSGGLPRAIVNGGLDVVRVHLSSRLASLPS